jgi:TP53 regulating kinase-like protein
MASSNSSNGPFQPAPRDEWTLLCQGAEAKVWKLSSNDGKEKWICKERFTKAYRHPELDERLTKSRCRTEARVLEKCIKNSDAIRVPKVVRLDPPLLYLEYLDGPTLKAHWNASKSSIGNKQQLSEFEEMAKRMGTVIGHVHNLGVVHGDLTTSNMIILNRDTPELIELALIDFGLAKSTTSAEEQACDLYVLERALLSTHPELPGLFFATLLQAYSDITESTLSSTKKSQNTLQRLEQVRLRGRKRECFG